MSHRQQLDAKLAQAMELLGNMGPEVKRILSEIEELRRAQTSDHIQIVEENRQALVLARAPPTPGSDDGYIPLRRPKRFEAQNQALLASALVSKDNTVGEDSDSETVVPEEEATNQLVSANSRSEEEVLDQGSSTTEQPVRWEDLQRQFEAAETAVWEAHSLAERTIDRIRVARQRDPEIYARSEASGIRDRFQILRQVTGAMKSARDLEQNRQKEAKLLAIQKAKIAEAEAALKKSREDVRRKQAELSEAKKGTLFAEIKADKKARLEEEWRKNPHKFFCILCGMPGVRRPKDCPRGHKK